MLLDERVDMALALALENLVDSNQDTGFFGTAINYGFGDVEETGILIAMDEVLEEKRVRHIDSFIKEHPEALKITSGANKVIYKEKSN